MPAETAKKPAAPVKETVAPTKDLVAEFKNRVATAFNDRYVKLNEAARNATNVWDRLDLEHRIKEVTDLYKIINDIK